MIKKLEPTPETGMVDLGDKINEIIDHLQKTPARTNHSRGVDEDIIADRGEFCQQCKNPLQKGICTCGNNIGSYEELKQFYPPEQEDEWKLLLDTLRDHSNYMVGSEDQCVVCGMNWVSLADKLEEIAIPKSVIKREIGKMLKPVQNITDGETLAILENRRAKLYNSGLNNLLSSLGLGD